MYERIMASSFQHFHRYTKLNTSPKNRLQIAMMSGNGFSVETSMTKDEIDQALASASHEERSAEFVSSDSTKTVVSVDPLRVEGYMLMPIEVPSELAIPTRRAIQ